MSNQEFYSRIIHKHDIEENWNKAINFIPKQGELIVYDIDENYDYERIKIGDGITNVTDLPFLFQIQLDEKVSNSGDTMTGTLKMQHLSMEQGVAPESGYGRYIQYVDKEGTNVAYHGLYQGTSSSYFQIRVYDALKTGTDNYTLLHVGHNASSLPYCRISSDSSVLCADTAGSMRNIQVRNSSNTTVSTNKIIMNRK